MSVSDYIKRFRTFRNEAKEQLGLREDADVMQHWLTYLEHFLCMCHECEGTTTINPPDASYYPQWPDRFDEDDEGDFTP